MKYLKNKRILLTCGPTWVPIDNVRVISNISSGKLGEILANDLRKKGAKVTVICGPANCLFDKKVKVIEFKFFDELVAILKKELRKKYDVVIHAAAVADYRLKKNSKVKINSNRKSLKLELVPTDKVINRIKKLNKHVHLVGFKLENSIKKSVTESKKLFKAANCDIVIANTLSGDKYRAVILNNKMEKIASANSRKSVSNALLKTLK